MPVTYVIKKEVFDPAELVGFYVKENQKVIENPLSYLRDKRLGGISQNIGNTSFLSILRKRELRVTDPLRSTITTTYFAPKYIGWLLKPFGYKKIKTLEEAATYALPEDIELEEVERMPSKYYVANTYGPGKYKIFEELTKRKGGRVWSEITTEGSLMDEYLVE